MGLNWLMSSCHRKRAARSMAISMKKFMPMPKKNDSRGANGVDVQPAFRAARTYSSPSASVKARLQHRVGPGLHHVIAADADGVVLGHVLGAVAR